MEKIKLYNLFSNLLQYDNTTDTFNMPTLPIINNSDESNVSSFLTGDIIELIYTQTNINNKKIFLVKENVIGGKEKKPQKINIILH